jgi:uncharacterized protein (TIGR02246 family)
MTRICRPEDFARGFQDAWNTHDIADLAALFHEDATFVNRFGRFVRGVEEIIALHKPLHETIYSDSTVANDIFDTTPVTDGVVIIHFWSRLTTGPAHPAGLSTIDTLILAVLTNQNGAWRIKALENVTLTDPRTGQPVLRVGHE